MSKSLKCTMEFSKGKLLNQNPVGYKQFLSLLSEGEELLVEFKRKKFEKSNKQLALAYEILGAIKEATGNTIEGLDLYVKHKLGKCYEEVIDGERVLNCKSKADFTKDELSEYINELISLAQNYQVDLSFLDLSVQ